LQVHNVRLQTFAFAFLVDKVNWQHFSSKRNKKSVAVLLQQNLSIASYTCETNTNKHIKKNMKFSVANIFCAQWATRKSCRKNQYCCNFSCNFRGRHPCVLMKNAASGLLALSTRNVKAKARTA